MNKELIKSFVIRNNYYIEIVEPGYIFPKYLYTLKGNKIWIKDIRGELLKGTKSNYEPSFIYDLEILKGKAVERKFLYNYVREFPVIIEDRELWEEILDGLKIPKEDRSWEVNYFVLDFFFYEADFIVEIDSEYHDGRELYDKARDLYIKNKLGLDTLRFYKYGKDYIDRATYQAAFRKKIKDSYNLKLKLGIISGRSVIDFSETIINNYTKENKQALLFIDSLSRFLGFKFKSSSSLEIHYEDLYRIFPKVFKRKTTDQELEKLCLSGFCNVLYDIYRKTLKILPSIAQENSPSLNP